MYNYTTVYIYIYTLTILMIQMIGGCFWMHVDFLNLGYICFEDLLDAGQLLVVAVVLVVGIVGCSRYIIVIHFNHKLWA